MAHLGVGLGVMGCRRVLWQEGLCFQVVVAGVASKRAGQTGGVVGSAGSFHKRFGDGVVGDVRADGQRQQGLTGVSQDAAYRAVCIARRTLLLCCGLGNGVGRGRKRWARKELGGRS